MTQVKEFIDLLSHPFPVEEKYSTQIIKLGYVSIFVSLFLYLLQPFQLSLSGSSLLYYCIGFGVITFLSGILFDLFAKYILGIKQSGESFTLGKWILITLCLILVIGINNFAFLYLTGGISIMGILPMIFATLVVGAFPLVFIGTYSMLKSERKNIKIAQAINEEAPPKPIVEENPVSIFGIICSDIIFIEAVQNYINIHYKKEDSVDKAMERATLKSLLPIIEGTSLVKCHRSYIVNKSKITNVSGNAQGLKLSLDSTDHLVPVSRSFIPLFKG